ncbi:MAG TPA: sialidase family protein [Candidatus Thermoplasmatota archaeon]|nr:sialidase family protein [Candidatus Thermoplasmatota archaeon]
MQRAAVLLAVTLALGMLAPGCLDASNTSSSAARPTGPLKITFSVLNASDPKEPIAFAQITLLADHGPLLAVATDEKGNAPISVPADATGFEVFAQGYLPSRGDLDRAPKTIIVRLKPVTDVTQIGESFGLRFRPAIDLGSKAYAVAAGTSCQDAAQDRDGNCGLGEPSVEVDSKGTIYVSGVCCIGNAPPVYVSRDDGKTFQVLSTPGVREAFGIEGDFAIDDAGVIYFADIELAASFQVTAWDATGRCLRHMKWPAPPLVDRDWIRAEGNGKLYYVYNTGSSTNVYTSQDGGATWTPRPAYTANFGLGGAVKGTKPGELWLLSPGAADGTRRAVYTLDGGTTWKAEPTKSPAAGMANGAFDEAGNLYSSGGRQDRVYATLRTTDGVWHDPVMVSPNFGHHRMPWVAGGGPGKAAMAWYGTLDEKTDAKWYLFVAVSLDADQPDAHWQVAVADPEPVVVGTLGRQLLDFLQVEIGPDGAIHVAYSKLRPTADNGEEVLHYVHSEPTLPLQMTKYFNGPKAA